MQIVVLDGYPLNPGDCSWSELAALGEFNVYERTDPADIVPRAATADVLVVNKIVLGNHHFSALPQLRLVTVVATGYDMIDLPSAAQHGVTVCNVPEYGTRSVAQHVFALLLELCHRVSRHDALVREGAWEARGDFCFWESPIVELAGKRLGIVGWGRIGQQVGRIGAVLGMELLASSRGAVATSDELPLQSLGLDELFSAADVVTLHCPLTERTRGLVNAERLARMPNGAVLINTARGGLVIEKDLAAGLAAGRPVAAAIDVCATEPISGDSPLLAAPHLLITPHMAWGSLAARRRLMTTTAENIRMFLAGTPQNVVGQPAV